MNGKYNKSTYIGYLKLKKGGMKIVPGHKDDLIINRRNDILNHLELVFEGKKKLKEKNISKYFKALGGKYIRNDICTTSDKGNCKRGRNISIGGADKLLRLAGKNKFSMENVLSTFKGSAPSLYEKLESKLTGSRNHRISDARNLRISDPRMSDPRMSRMPNLERPVYNYMQDGGDALEKFRVEIGRSGDIELNKLRKEINKIRNNI